jgi:hypothetical protein
MAEINSNNDEEQEGDKGEKRVQKKWMTMENLNVTFYT